MNAQPVMFGKLKIGEVPRIVAVIAGPPTDFVGQAETARGADLLEFRADYCDRDSVAARLAQVREVSDLPILLTIRKLTEGGYFFQDETARLGLFEELLSLVDAVDIELYATEIRDPVIALAHAHKKPVIVSYHDFQRTPTAAELDEVAKDAVLSSADMLKVAVMALDREDVSLLQAFTASFSHDILLTSISMGDVGTASRILNPFLGSCLTYGYVGQGKPTVRGQIPVEELRGLINEFQGGRITLENAEELLTAAVSGSAH